MEGEEERTLPWDSLLESDSPEWFGTALGSRVGGIDQGTDPVLFSGRSNPG